MKKMRKVLSLIIALAFLFSVAAPAMAATPTDAEKAGNRLLSLGLIEGYPGGGLGLDQTITRAEITVILARIAGMGTAADLLKNTPSKFSDVKVGEWYTGWINLASSQGWVKGDPQGTFRPNDPVQYREIITMLMKALGYNDNLPGDWPTNYLAKAATLGVSKGISFDAKAAANRGDVFRMTSKTLDEETVTYDKDNDKFVLSGKTLLEDKMDFSKVEGTVTAIPRVASSLKDNQIKINNKLYKVVGDVDFEEVFGTEVKAWLNDDDEIVFIDIDSDTILYDALEDVTEDELTLVDADADYDLADDILIYSNGEKIDADDLLDAYDYAKVVLDDDGDVAFIDAYTWDDFLVVEKVDGYDVLGYGDEIDAEDYTIVKDGVTIGLEDLAKGDILFYNSNAEFAEVFNKSYSGEIEKIYEDEITVAGEDYGTELAKYINEDGDIADLGTGDSMKDVAEAMQDSGKVVVFVDRNGDMRFLSGDLGDLITTSSYVFVTADSTRYLDRGTYKWTLDVLNSQGQEVDYDIKETDVDATGSSLLKDADGDDLVWSAGLIVEGMVVELKIDKDGDIDQVRLLAEDTISSRVKTTEKYRSGLKIDTAAPCYLTEDYTDDVDDIVIKAYKDLDFDYIDAGTFFVKDDKVVAIVVSASDREDDSDDYLTVATADQTKVAGESIWRLKLVIDGAKVTKETKKGISDPDVSKGDFLSVAIDNKTGKVNSVSKDVYEVAAAEISAIKTSDKSFKIGGTSYKLGTDGVVVDATDSYKVISLSNLKAGDLVRALLVADGSKYVAVLVRTDTAGDSSSPDADITADYDGTADTLTITVSGVSGAYAVRVYDVDSGDAIGGFSVLSSGSAVISGITTDPVFVTVKVYDSAGKLLVQSQVATE